MLKKIIAYFTAMVNPPKSDCEWSYTDPTTGHTYTDPWEYQVDRYCDQGKRSDDEPELEMTLEELKYAM